MSYNIRTKSEDYEIDLKLRGSRTVISGDSGSGKSFLFEVLRKAKSTKNMLFIDYAYAQSEGNYDAMVSFIENSTDKIFVMDQADAIQRIKDDMMLAINLDSRNKFIIIGRHPEIIYNISDICHVVVEDNRITLEYDFEEPMTKRR